MDINQINKAVQAEINSKRIAAEAKAQKNLSLANSRPIFSKICALEKDLIFELGKAEANGEKASTLKKELKQVKEQKKKYLASLGLTEADLVPKYSCEKCKDTGFIGTVLCTCSLNARNERFIKDAGLSPDKNINFESFNSKLAKSEKQQAELEKLKEKLMLWCEKYPNVNKKTIILYGQTGVGKTYASKCVASKLEALGNSVCCVSAFQMNEMFLKYHTSFDSNKSSYLSPLTESEILVVDDLGTEPILSNVTINYLYLMLSERERLNKATIITTNLSPDKLKEQYGERIYSRLLSKFSSIYLKIAGDDLRN